MDSNRRKLIFSGLLAVTIVLTGTAGYAYLENWSLLEAFYMTVITVATIGYGEIKPLSDQGRVFTIFLILFGVGNMAYLVGQFTRAMVEGSLQRVLGRRILESQIRKAKNHYVLCGYGRIGKMVAREIDKKKIPVIVIENHPEELESLEKENRLYIRGDASDEDNLLAAGIQRASGLISAVSSDADNLYIVLTARGLNQDLFILSRASEERSIKKLLGAGADRVISPYLIGARKMAQALLRPTVADFLETTVHGGAGMNLAMEEVLVTPQSKIKDVSLLDSNIRRDLDLIVIAIKTAEGEMLFNPSAQARINVGDTLIAVGQRKNMDSLCLLLGADLESRPRYTKGRGPDGMRGYSVRSD